MLTEHDKIKELLAVASPADKVTLQVIIKGAADAMRAYNQNPTAPKKRDWDAARTGQTDIVNEMWAKYFGDTDPAGKTFANLLEVLAYLQDQGYDLKKSKLYKDRKDGLIRMEPDGRSVLEAEVLSYAVKAGLKRRVDIDARELEAAAERKARAEIRKLEASARMTEFDLAVKEGKYLLKEDAVRARIDQMQILEITFRQMIHTRMADWLSTASGDMRRLNDVRDLADAAVDDMFNGLAKSDTFAVEYEA